MPKYHVIACHVSLCPSRHCGWRMHCSSIFVPQPQASEHRRAFETMDVPPAPPDPFTASPSQSGSNTPLRPISPGEPAASSSTSPVPPEFTRRLSNTASHLSAASGSPPPTHRASFPDPSKEPKRGSSRLSGPPAKEGYCCERDKEIAKGEEVSIVDAFKTTEGGTATYITYVIRLGVSQEPC